MVRKDRRRGLAHDRHWEEIDAQGAREHGDERASRKARGGSVKGEDELEAHKRGLGAARHGRPDESGEGHDIDEAKSMRDGGGVQHKAFGGKFRAPLLKVKAPSMGRGMARPSFEERMALRGAGEPIRPIGPGGYRAGGEVDGDDELSGDRESGAVASHVSRKKSGGKVSVAAHERSKPRRETMSTIAHSPKGNVNRQPGGEKDVEVPEFIPNHEHVARNDPHTDYYRPVHGFDPDQNGEDQEPVVDDEDEE
jgi:hypothetical protein